MLDKSLFFIGCLAIYNSIQCYIPKFNVTKRIYQRQPDQVTALMGRMMGTWTLTSAIVRIYTSYHISSKAAYDLTMAAFLVSFSTEVFVYKTSPFTSPGVFPTFFFTIIHLIWMYQSYGDYVKIWNSNFEYNLFSKLSINEILEYFHSFLYQLDWARSHWNLNLQKIEFALK